VSKTSKIQALRDTLAILGVEARTCLMRGQSLDRVHRKADAALLRHIGDRRAARLFRSIPKWYA